MSRNNQSSDANSVRLHRPNHSYNGIFTLHENIHATHVGILSVGELELSITSKNSLRGITLGTRRIWRINSLHPLSTVKKEHRLFCRWIVKKQQSVYTGIPIFRCVCPLYFVGLCFDFINLCNNCRILFSRGLVQLH